MLRGGLGGMRLHVGLHLAVDLCGGAGSYSAGVDAGRHVMRMKRRRR